MIMVMTAAGAVHMPVLISLNRSFQFLTAYRAFSDFRLVEQEVDDLVLIKRRAKLGCGHWLLLDIWDEALATLGIILLRGLLDEAVHFGQTDRASWRERVCTYGEQSVAAGPCKNNRQENYQCI